MTPPHDRLALASPDDAATAADWERATAAVLRKSGRMSNEDPDDLVWSKLTRTTLDGIEVAPIASPADAASVTTEGRPVRTGDWDVRAHFIGPDAAAANEAALVDLDGGVSSLWLELGQGLEVAALPRLLDGVLLDLAPVVLDAPEDRVGAARALLDLLGETVPAAGTNLGAAWDDEHLVEVARLALEAGTLGVVVDATRLHDLGASDAQELGWSLAAGIVALRTLTAAGLELEQALGLLEFRFAATDEQFPTIAKLRAARRVWSRVVELSGGSTEAGVMRQHVVTSRPMMSKYDPWVNMLRTTVAAFAAGVAGADSLTVLPFDAPLGLPDGLGRRNARNTSALLLAESHVAAVTDPAGGSYAVERLTDDLAHAAWAELGRIEEVGGLAAATADGSLQARVDAVVAVRDAEIARRKRPLTGLSEFPNLAEVLPSRVPHPSSDAVRRYGAPFEALRDEPAERPVFLATLGPVAQHTARATFATNLLAAGGIGVDVAGATSGVDDVLAAYAGQQVVVLAGTDATYVEWGAPLVAALRDAGAARVVVAGKPGDLGVDDACAMGVDALDFLTRTREALS
jgi:methylmalonyl-CoA mutase